MKNELNEVRESEGRLSYMTLNERGEALAVCLKTYPDEDDMRAFCDGDIIEASDVKIYHKDKKYWVNPKFVDLNYYRVLSTEE